MKNIIDSECKLKRKHIRCKGHRNGKEEVNVKLKREQYFSKSIINTLGQNDVNSRRKT